MVTKGIPTLILEMDCDQTAMGLSLVISAVFLIAKSFFLNVGLSEEYLRCFYYSSGDKVWVICIYIHNITPVSRGDRQRSLPSICYDPYTHPSLPLLSSNSSHTLACFVWVICQMYIILHLISDVVLLIFVIFEWLTALNN
jgi:hypothetical protein